MERDKWAAARALLRESAANKASLSAVESAALLLCLDHQYPQNAAERARVMWHGVIFCFFPSTFYYVLLRERLSCGTVRAGTHAEHERHTFWTGALAHTLIFSLLTHTLFLFFMRVRRERGARPSLCCRARSY
jgi:hypothetical protein